MPQHQLFDLFGIVLSGLALHLNSYLSVDFQAFHLSAVTLHSYCMSDLASDVHSRVSPGQNSCFSVWVWRSCLLHRCWQSLLLCRQAGVLLSL